MIPITVIQKTRVARLQLKNRECRLTPTTRQFTRMTDIDHPHAAPYSCPMIAELETLESKIHLVAERCQTLLSDNVGLRHQLLSSQQEVRQLNA